MGLFNLFKVVPAAELVKENPFAVKPQGKETPKPVQKPKQDAQFWADEEMRQTVYFEAQGQTAQAPGNRSPQMTSADVAGLEQYGLWPKKQKAQTKYHDIKAYWAQGNEAKDIAARFGVSDSVAEKCCAVFNKNAVV